MGGERGYAVYAAVHLLLSGSDIRLLSGALGDMYNIVGLLGSSCTSMVRPLSNFLACLFEFSVVYCIK